MNYQSKRKPGTFESNIQDRFFLLPPDKQGLVIKLRGIIISSSIELRETLKNGRITFVTDKSPVAFLCVKKDTDYVEVGFFKGVFLNDPDELLKGKSKEIRRIKILSENKIPVLQIKRWVREAVRYK
ncbi:MAG: DUF1801 domain-containing protein [Ignavibacteria bacterium]|nr:DUF1801 domain-containing protein [Ignavibacteria bacterium]